MPLWPGDALSAPWWIAKIAQMCAKIDNLIEASGYDDDHLLAPYALWPSHKHIELKDWLDDRQEQAKAKSAPKRDPNA